MRIFTGAPVPPGADAVVMQEDTESHADQARSSRRQVRTRTSRKRGEDLAVGAVLIKPHTRVQPGHIGLLASQGHARVDVYRRPRVAVLPTGDELRDLGDPPRPVASSTPTPMRWPHRSEKPVATRGYFP